MKLVLEATVVGHALIKNDFEVAAGEITFAFTRGSDGRLERVIATMTVAPDAIKTSFRPGTTTDWELTVNGGEESHALMRSALQRLHAHLGFSAQGAIERADWREAAVRFVPETDEERAKLKVFSASVRTEWPKQMAGLGEPLLKSCVEATATHDHTFIPKSFWLEAQRCFMEQRYIQAFYSFYFVIEACFAEGKFRENDVVDRFVASSELGAAIETALKGISQFPEHRREIERLGLEEKVQLDVEGLCRLLFRIRGRLHHFSESSSRLQPTVFNDEKFHTMALFTSSIATQIILLLDMKVAPMYVANTTNLR